MKFEPMTDKQILESNLIPDGKYKCEVLSATDTDNYGNPLLSRNGNPKIDLLLKILVNDKMRTKKCSLTPAFIKVLKHFCDSTGLQEQYENGEVTAEVINKLNKDFIVEIKMNEFVNSKGDKILTDNVIDFHPLEENKSPFNDDISF
jgi:hypothetical protein